MEIYILILSSVSIGIIIGAVLSNISWCKKKSNGTLKVDANDPDGPYLFLELSRKDLSNIAGKKQITLKVENISRK